ncbi:unnamed protein product [Pleuronectes platessa]|uniref:Uncharacterized protein n=1 Tax=Pleuronectes platessa TaxID=8262 RepID=A0A9N7YY42_PLEPL|nr:unnamed protein product [Pleuronectes platessa]
MEKAALSMIKELNANSAKRSDHPLPVFLRGFQPQMPDDQEEGLERWKEATQQLVDNMLRANCIKPQLCQRCLKKRRHKSDAADCMPMQTTAVIVTLAIISPKHFTIGHPGFMASTSTAANSCDIDEAVYFEGVLLCKDDEVADLCGRHPKRTSMCQKGGLWQSQLNAAKEESKRSSSSLDEQTQRDLQRERQSLEAIKEETCLIE